MTGNDRGTNAGSYVATYTPDENHIWADTKDRAPVSVTLIIDRAVAGNKPEAINVIVDYDGNEHTNNYVCQQGIVMSGSDRGVGVGNYVAVYVPSQNYKWSDNTFEEVSITLSIVVDYLCFTANTAGSTIAMSVNGTPTLGQNFQTSFDQQNWSVFTPGSTVITLPSIGSKVYFKGNNPNGVNEVDTGSSTDRFYYKFSMTGTISASGNIMTLIGAALTYEIPNPGCFLRLFYGCSSLVSAPRLPARVMKDRCYRLMFRGTGISVAPELPATTLAQECYNQIFSTCTSLTTGPSQIPENAVYAPKFGWMMFYNCSSLTTPPLLPNINLSDECYYGMFQGCTSLRYGPQLLATTLKYHCYSSMFQDCSSLQTAPSLPATNLASRCYWSMFYGCSALYAAPNLPAAYVPDESYISMFSYCYSLAVPPVMSATYLGANACEYMFRSCTSLRTVPKLHATTIGGKAPYLRMFQNCSNLVVSSWSSSGVTSIWRIPNSGTFSSTYSSSGMFEGCAGSRSSDDMPGGAGYSYTYYTQNAPI